MMNEDPLGLSHRWKMAAALIYDANDEALSNFAGTLFRSVEAFHASDRSFKLVYVCGDADAILRELRVEEGTKVFAVRELVATPCLGVPQVSILEVPRDVHHVGLFFPKFFAGPKDYYANICEEHTFQQLKLGTKPGEAFRQGIYLTPVRQVSDEELRFHLLRCSTNLGGPTENFRVTDQEIVGALNAVRPLYFPESAESAELNHVLAQTYHNSVDADGKTHKAKISTHSDKTKDMPAEGMLVFCTFYAGYAGNFAESTSYRKQENGDFVWGKSESVLTKLRFHLKPEAAKLYPTLKKQFDVTLLPNSVFMVTLEINRFYTHAIVPSSLPVDKIPTRLGYVVRCSNTQAVHRAGQTLIVTANGDERPLDPPTKEGVKELTEMYMRENTSIEKIDYTDRFFFSMNGGDYLKPVP